jgi:hypothetical protein
MAVLLLDIIIYLKSFQRKLESIKHTNGFRVALRLHYNKKFLKI